MALDPNGYDPGFLQWLNTWGQPIAQPQPLAIDAPEYGAPTVGSVPLPPPPPPPPPPQHIGPGSPFADETAAPEQLPPPAAEAPPPAPSDTAALPAVGSGLDQYGFAKDTAVAPEQTAPPVPFDPLAPQTWAGPPAPTLPEVGTTRAMGTGALPLDDNELVQLAHTDPLAYAKYNAQKDAELADFANQRNAELQKTEAAQAEQAERQYLDSQERARQVTESALADSQALAAEKPKKFMDSVGNALGSVLSLALSSFFAPAGTTDKVVGMLQKRMDDFAQEQINEYNRKSGAVDRKLNIAARLRDAGYNEYQAKTVIRMAGLQRAREQLLTDMQNFDPKGTTARKIAGTVLQTESALAQNAEAMRRQHLDDEIKQADLLNKQLDAQKKMAKLQGVGAGGGVGTGAKAGRVSRASLIESLGPDAEHFVPAEPPGGFPIAQANQIAEFAKKSREVRQFETEEDRKLGIRGPDGNLLVSKDTGKPIRLRDEAEATKLTDSIVATDQAVRLMDEVIRLRKEHGWEPDFLQSPAWQQVQQAWGDLMLQKKNIEQLGAISGSDMDLMSKALGSKDPTGVRDNIPGILSARRNAVLRLQANLRTRGVADQSIPKYSPLTGLDNAGNVEGDADRKLVLRPDNSEQTDDERDMGKVVSTKAQRAVIDKWSAQLDSNDPAVRDQAARDLLMAANNSPAIDLQNQAHAALGKVLKQGETPYEEPAMEGRSVAHETVPPVPKPPEKPKKKPKTDSAGNPL